MYGRRIIPLFSAGLLLAASCVAQAQSYSGTVIDSDCEVISTTTSAAGAVGGSVVGGAVGSVVGDALFGRSGRIIGGFLGSGGGAVAGERALSQKTYRCVITVEVSSVGKVYVETLGAVRNIGQSIILVKTTDGRWISK